jgi:hypothetical protein
MVALKTVARRGWRATGLLCHRYSPGVYTSHVMHIKQQKYANWKLVCLLRLEVRSFAAVAKVQRPCVEDALRKKCCVRTPAAKQKYFIVAGPSASCSDPRSWESTAVPAIPDTQYHLANGCCARLCSHEQATRHGSK